MQPGLCPDHEQLRKDRDHDRDRSQEEGVVCRSIPQSGWANNWDIRLNEDVPVDVNVECRGGHSQLRARFTEPDARSLSTTAPANTAIDLGGYHGGPFLAEIHNGVGDLTVRIPRNSNTRILVHHGVGDITIERICTER